MLKTSFEHIWFTASENAFQIYVAEQYYFRSEFGDNQLLSNDYFDYNAFAVKTIHFYLFIQHHTC